MQNAQKPKSVAVVGHIYKFLSTGEQTGGSFAMFESLIPPKDPGPPPHIHHNEDESFYILEGDFTIFLGDKEYHATEGDFMFLPRGVKHTFRHNADTVGKQIIIVTPSGFENFFEAVGTPVNDGSKLPPPPTKEDIEKLIREAPKFGLEILL